MMARLRVLNWRSASSSVSAASAQTQIVAMGLGLISLGDSSCGKDPAPVPRRYLR